MKVVHHVLRGDCRPNISSVLSLSQGNDTELSDHLSILSINGLTTHKMLMAHTQGKSHNKVTYLKLE